MCVWRGGGVLGEGAGIMGTTFSQQALYMCCLSMVELHVLQLLRKLHLELKLTFSAKLELSLLHFTLSIEEQVSNTQ